MVGVEGLCLNEIEFHSKKKKKGLIVEVTTKPDFPFFFIKIFSLDQDFPSSRITILPVWGCVGNFFDAFMGEKIEILIKEIFLHVEKNSS
jgi:hypothetical protein